MQGQAQMSEPAVGLLWMENEAFMFRVDADGVCVIADLNGREAPSEVYTYMRELNWLGWVIHSSHMKTRAC